MFTGIIHHVGSVLKIDLKSGEFGPEVSLRARTKLRKASQGESVAVEGVCLTVLNVKKNKQGTDLAFNVSQETLERTTLRFLKIGMEINIEPSLRVGDPLGGHFMQGHVDEVGKILRIIPQGNSKLYWFSCPPGLEPCLVPKGSVAVNGVSLTVAGISSGKFCASILPFTEKETSFRDKKPGDWVNLEGDILAKVVVKQMLTIGRKEKSPSLAF